MLGDFFVVESDARIVGCAALHVASGTVEILAVAVRPDAQGKGIGKALMSAALDRAKTRSPGAWVWLATAKPMYFTRFGFAPMSKWRLPLAVLVHKLLLVFHQPAARWLPALFGRHTFMRLS